ncbi:MAG TPA: alpha/beta hydrolase [Anaerolineae bacterium]|jgi:pimeloyl-ACP methyl ester carboxylesterase|nr:alpha/beta hydrolase [Anaerolineae bacterium]
MEKAFEYRIKSVELSSGVKLPYAEQEDPSGIPLLLLHGYVDSWRSFELVLPSLPDSAHAIALTQRGHGDASRPPTGYRPRDHAADVAEFMDALQLKAAVIAGGSSGGFAARRLAMDYPERTLGLVLLGSPFTLRDKPEVQEMWQSTISGLTDPVDPGFVREFQESTHVRPVPADFLCTMIEESLKVPARVWRATLEGLLEEDSSEDLGKIKAPTLILWGDQDAVVPLGDQEKLAAGIEGAQLVVYPGVGHAIYWEAPGQVATDIGVFIEEHAR